MGMILSDRFARIRWRIVGLVRPDGSIPDHGIGVPLRRLEWQAGQHCVRLLDAKACPKWARPAGWAATRFLSALGPRLQMLHLKTRARPEVLSSDDWCRAGRILRWSEDHKIGWHDIAPGNPQQNGCSSAVCATKCSTRPCSARSLTPASCDQTVPARCRKRAAARFRADWPSGKAPTTRVRRGSHVRRVQEDSSNVNVSTSPATIDEDLKTFAVVGWTSVSKGIKNP
jgi:hypothetical protein